MKNNSKFLHLALQLAWRGYGATSPNPMVGAVLVKGGRIIGRGWHRRAGLPHAEIEALSAARKHGHNPRGATLYVTLEPCCTQGRTPPCTDALVAAGVKHVVVGAIDPNPSHSGRAFKILKRADIKVDWWGEPNREPENKSKHSSAAARPRRMLAAECARLNEAFNHWIVYRTPFVTIKAAMTLDGKIATAGGESKWITGEAARAYAMQLRRGVDAVLVGLNTVLADNPSLTARVKTANGKWRMTKPVRRIILDAMARTPLDAEVVSDEFATATTIVASKRAPRSRVAALAKRVNVVFAPLAKSATGNSALARARDKSLCRQPAIDLSWLLKKLGSENITSLLVEGGGEVNGSFLLGGFAQRVVFFYAPKILGGRDARKGVAGEGAESITDSLRLQEVEWKRFGADLMLSARVA